MGLAASQARLLTITSRMSSVELRQQRIAMDKMRLANDQDEVVEKYTNALNNKTLSISNGGQEVPMTYEALKSHGYSVAKASEASSISTVTVPRQTVVTTPTVSNTTPTTNTSSIKKPTCPRPEEIKRPAIIDQPSDWCAAGIALDVNDFYFDSNSRFSHSLSSIVGELVGGLTYAYYTPSGSRTSGDMSLDKNINEYDYLKKENTDYETTLKNIREHWENKVIPAMNDCLSSSRYSDEEKKRMEMTKNLFNQHFYEVINADYPDSKTAIDAVVFVSKEMQHLLVGDSLDTNRPIFLADETDWTMEVRNKVNATSTGQTSKQRHAEVDYKEEVAQARAAWEKYDKAVASAGSTSSTNASPSVSSSPVISTGSYSSSSYVPSKDLEDQLKNSQFLIQGLLSGYLVLMKDGQQVSLSSATDIIESYDKSDDAAAEAEYNAQMSKINRKEKMLDMQAKRLDTEYSALTTEYDSVKNLIQNHTQKDFSYFS